MQWTAVHASQVTQVAAENIYLDVVRHRGKALLLGFKDGNACGLQASLGHADAAVANPILHQQKNCQMHSTHVGANAAFSLICRVFQPLPMLIVTLQAPLLNVW